MGGTHNCSYSQLDLSPSSSGRTSANPETLEFNEECGLIPTVEGPMDSREGGSNAAKQKWKIVRGRLPSIVRRSTCKEDRVAEGFSKACEMEGSVKCKDHGAFELDFDKEPTESIWKWDTVGEKVSSMLRLSPRTRALLLFNLSSLLSGTDVVVVKGSADDINPVLFCSLQYILASAIFSPWLAAAFANKSTRRAGLELGLWGGAAELALAIGLTTTSASRATFIAVISVIVVPILAGLLGARIPKLTWVAAAAAILGVGLLHTSGPGSLLLMSALCCSLVAGAMRLSAGDSIMPLASSTDDWMTLAHNLIALPWVSIIYTGIFSTAFCIWTELSAFCDISAAEGAIIYTMETVWGAAFAWVLLGERWGALGWIGAALIISGSVAMNLYGEVPEGEPLPGTMRHPFL